MRIAYELYINDIHYATYYSNCEDIMLTIEEIKQKYPDVIIKETYACDNLGRKVDFCIK